MAPRVVPRTALGFAWQQHAASSTCASDPVPVLSCTPIGVGVSTPSRSNYKFICTAITFLYLMFTLTLLFGSYDFNESGSLALVLPLPAVETVYLHCYYILSLALKMSLSHLSR